MSIEEELYKELIDKMNTYHPTKEFNMIDRAYHLAVEAHKEQLQQVYCMIPLRIHNILMKILPIYLVRKWRIL